MESMTFNNKEVMSLYIAVSHTYTELKTLVESPECDRLSSEEQFFILENYRTTLSLYARLTEYLESVNIPVRDIYYDDISPVSPRKDV